MTQIPNVEDVERELLDAVFDLGEHNEEAQMLKRALAAISYLKSDNEFLAEENGRQSLQLNNDRDWPAELAAKPKRTSY